MKNAFLKLHISVLIAGFTGIFGKLISLNEGLLVWYRIAFSVAILTGILLVTRRLKRLPLSEGLGIALAGVLLMLHWVFFYGSIKYANVSVGVVCFSMTSFFTALFDPLMSRRRFSAAELFLSGLTILGVALIFHFDTKYRTGILLGIVSSAVVAVFTVRNKVLAMRYESGLLTLYLLAGGIVALTVMMPVYLYYFPVASPVPNLADLGYLLILSVVCTIVMYFLINQALKSISAFTVNLSFNLEPVYTIILAVFLFRENREFTPAFYFGLFLIVLSMILQTVRDVSKHRRSVLTGASL